MARLKVKQISDFDSKVNSLIGDAQVNVDASIDSLESQVSSNYADLSDRIDDAEAQNSTDHATLSDALSVEIDATTEDVRSIDLRVSLDEDALAAEVSTTNSEVLSLSTRIGDEETTRSVDVKAVSDAVEAILAGSTTDLDQFAEVISYVDSLDTADGGALTSAIASLEGVVSGNTSADAVLSAALSSEIDATTEDVRSIDAVLASAAANTDNTNVSNALAAEISTTNSEVLSIDTRISNAEDFESQNHTAISDALVAEISTTNSEVISLDAYIGGVSADLATEIAATNGDVDSLEKSIGSVETALDGFAKEAYIHGVFSDIETRGGMTAVVNDTTGAQLEAGATANEFNANVAVDLVSPIEGNNALEREANLVFVTINGQYINQDAILIQGPTQFDIIGGALGFDIELDDVFEFKYIKD